jgi:hypothetical protein
MVGYMPDERGKKTKGHFEGNFRGGIAGEYATPSKIAKNESKYFGKEGWSSIKTCPQVHKKFEDFATIAPSEDELQYFCPYCDALIVREFDDMGERKVEVYDWDHMPD